MRKLLEVIGVSIVIMVSQVYTYVLIHQIVYIKYAQFYISFITLKNNKIPNIHETLGIKYLRYTKY